MATSPVSAVADPALIDRPRPGPHRLIPVTVAARTLLAPRLVRLRLTAPEFAEYTLSGPDEYFGLLMPAPGQDFTPFPLAAGANIRAAVSALPADRRPELRWYTVRNLDRDAAAIDVDIVTHGDDGPGSHWALRARPGDRAGVYTCSGIWSRPVRDQLLVADATAVPALRSILEFTAAHHPGAMTDLHAVVLAASPEQLEPGLDEWADRIGSLAVHYAPDDAQADLARSLLGDHRRSGHPAAQAGCTWTCGEAGLAKAARSLAVGDWAVPVDRAGWATYWIIGRARP